MLIEHIWHEKSPSNFKCKQTNKTLFFSVKFDSNVDRSYFEISMIKLIVKKKALSFFILSFWIGEYNNNNNTHTKSRFYTNNMTQKKREVYVTKKEEINRDIIEKKIFT